VNQRVRDHLERIFRAGLAAVDPADAVRRCVRVEGDILRVGDADLFLPDIRRIFVLGAGKASVRMARALEDLLGGRITGGWINTKTGHAEALSRIHVHEAGHPVPDEAGRRGAEELLKIAREAGEGDLVLFCLSGGGSALLPAPVEGVSLEDKQAVTRELLACGADIREINAVRKHLSRVKGGRLARAAHPARLVSLILSDVIGDPLDVIASGPTAPDASTFADALAVIEKYALADRVPAAVRDYLTQGAAGKHAETPKPGDPLLDGVDNVIIASNATAVNACAAEAKRLGWPARVLSTRMEGEAREAARALIAVAREALEAGRPVKPPACLICGGETTVTLRGNGRGGRNQELALSAAMAGRDTRGWALLAAGTDGTDGPTDAAGAFADGKTCARAEQLGLNPGAFLRENDAYTFFDRLGDLLKTGPTGTNVMDLTLVLVGAQPEGAA
jgi:hydroxypyruvate reductase